MTSLLGEAARVRTSTDGAATAAKQPSQPLASHTGGGRVGAVGGCSPTVELWGPQESHHTTSAAEELGGQFRSAQRCGLQSLCWESKRDPGPLEEALLVSTFSTALIALHPDARSKLSPQHRLDREDTALHPLSLLTVSNL